MIDMNSIEDVVPAQDTLSMLRKLTDAEFQALAAQGEKVLEVAKYGTVPSIQALFPALEKAQKAKRIDSTKDSKRI